MQKPRAQPPPSLRGTPSTVFAQRVGEVSPNEVPADRNALRSSRQVFRCLLKMYPAPTKFSQRNPFTGNGVSFERSPRFLPVVTVIYSRLDRIANSIVRGFSRFYKRSRWIRIFLKRESNKNCKGCGLVRRVFRRTGPNRKVKRTSGRKIFRKLKNRNYRRFKWIFSTFEVNRSTGTRDDRPSFEETIARCEPYASLFERPQLR